MAQNMTRAEPPLAAATSGAEALHALALWSPFVVGLRLPLLWNETTMFSLADRPETNRLVGEKLGAFSEGVFAVQSATLTAMFGFAEDALHMRFDVGSVGRAAEAILRAGLDPAVERVRENAERLSTTVGRHDG